MCIDLYTHSLVLSSIPLDGVGEEEASRGMCPSVVFTVTDSEGYSSPSVCLFVCLSVYDYSRTTGKKKNVGILLKQLRSRDMP